MKTVIEARGLGKDILGQPILEDVQVTLSEGECLGVIGPSSSGKSTLIHILAGQLKLDHGELFVFDHNARINLKNIRAIVGVVPSYLGFEYDSFALDSLVCHGYLYGGNLKALRMRARNLLRLVQLDEYESWPITDLSEGQLFRLSLARAMINEPKVLFIDPDLSRLGEEDRKKFWSLISSLKARGTTMVVSARDLSTIERLCDRVVILEHGKIVCQGTPAGLVQSHVGRSVVEYTVAPHELEYHLQALRGRFQYQLIRDRLKIFVNSDNASMADFQWLPSDQIVFRKAELRDVLGKVVGVDFV